MGDKPYPTAPPVPMATGFYQAQYPTGYYPVAQYPTSYPYQQPFGSGGQPVGLVQPPPYSQHAPPVYSQYPGPPVPSAMYAPPPQVVMAPGLYDAGARFDGIAQPRIPPPPPGVAPNQAQMAAFSGSQVIGTQQNSSLWTGNRNDGGYTWF